MLESLFRSIHEITLSDRLPCRFDELFEVIGGGRHKLQSDIRRLHSQALDLPPEVQALHQVHRSPLLPTRGLFPCQKSSRLSAIQ